jgi:hypothetical protein
MIRRLTERSDKFAWDVQKSLSSLHGEQRNIAMLDANPGITTIRILISQCQKLSGLMCGKMSLKYRHIRKQIEKVIESRTMRKLSVTSYVDNDGHFRFIIRAFPIHYGF